MRGFTTKEFIEKAKQKHGDYFDYSETVYVNRRTKVYIICPIHGGFWQFPEQHLKSQYGCPQCSYEAKSKEKRLGFEDFVIRATNIHGNMYSYVNVDYIDEKTKVEIICKKHGAFMQTPAAHLHGQGCPLCGIEKIRNSKLLSQNEVIEAFKRVHGDTYDYSKVEYKGSQVEIAIICKEHGIFYQKPAYHMYVGCGCPVCGDIKRGLSERQTKSEFVEKARLIHGDKYDYSLVPEDVLTSDKVPIVCKEHGVFLQTKNSHLKGQGCPHCPKTCVSLGEKKVSEWLDMKNIKYIPQYKIKNEDVNCENKHIIIDFYIPKENLFIEYNGEQHYSTPFYFGGEERFERQVRRDNALRKYCETHGVKLVEIPYWDYNNIGNILNKYLE